MTSARQTVRIEQQRTLLCAAAVRALTGDGRLHYRSGRIFRGQSALPTHVLTFQSSLSAKRGVLRGDADALAIRERFSDRVLHRRLRPVEAIAGMLFEVLEQIRCESLVPTSLRGVRQNLQIRFECWSNEVVGSNLTDSQIGILVYTAVQIAWSRILGYPLSCEAEDLIEATRAGIAQRIGGSLAGMRRHRTSQAQFAIHARQYAEAVAGMIEEELRDSADCNSSDQTSSHAAAKAILSVESDSDVENLNQIETVDAGVSKVLDASADGYQIYTRAYDREVNAGSLVRRTLLAELRAKLDQEIASLHINVGKLSRLMLPLFSTPRRDGWLDGEESGRIDGRRLPQIVCSPAERRVFRRDLDVPRPDCTLTFLIDCSGSMKQHGANVAVLVDVFSRALDRLGVAIEVLGFTTGAWNGGRARRDWLAAGRQSHPGRLNESCHLVFKEAAIGWRQSRSQIAALMKADLFREGIDGEAVEWACGRLLGRPEARRFLLVISDGSPMDCATGQANDAYYLDNHLRTVVSAHEQKGDVRIMALGVGLDLSPYYRHNLPVDLSEAPGMKLLQEIVEWMGRAMG